jgi:hypothetical protein
VSSEDDRSDEKQRSDNMKTNQVRRVALAFGATLCLATSGVMAQPPVETEEPWQPEPAPAPAEPAPPPVVEPAPAPAATRADAQTESEDEGTSDHAAMVGRTAVGFLGIASVPVGGALAAIAAPVIGVRHWMSERTGLDVGVGFGLERSSARFVPDVGDSVPLARQLGLAVSGHVGLPIAIFHRRHYAFLIIPEADIGFAFASEDPDPDIDDNELKHLGVVVQPGARFGSEVHFGFIGIPQLSLQASVGVRGRYEWTQSKATASDDRTRNHDISVGTTVQSSPWNIFITNVAALYYF